MKSMGWAGVLTDGNDYPHLVYDQLNAVEK